jgi:hypothetical protein
LALKKTVLPLVVVILGLSVIGILLTYSEGDFAACPQPKGAPVYVRAVSSSSGDVISGVRVSGTAAWLCYTTDVSQYIVQYSPLRSLITPANGTVRLGTLEGNYTLSLEYSGQKYVAVVFESSANLSLLLTISFPSGDSQLAACQSVSTRGCYNGTVA